MRLLVVLNDRLSALVKKGEITDRYYNPGNLFDDVTLLLTNDDSVSVSALQRTVGKARLSLTNAPVPSFSRSLGWRAFFLSRWIQQGVEIAKNARPDLIRTHGNFENGYLAAKIKQKLNVPLVVSLHTDPDEDMRASIGWRVDWKDRLMRERMKYFERVTLTSADLVLPVYESLRPYAEKFGARKIQVCYNVLNPSGLKEKKSYQSDGPAKLVWVGRQIWGKNPDNIIRAVSKLNAHLTLIGDGSLLEKSKKLAAEMGGAKKFEFIESMPNDEVCKRLPEFDILVTHCQYNGISKVVLEGLLTGLPIVHNRRVGRPVPELEGDWVYPVENTPESYGRALQDLIDHPEKREKLGKSAYTFSHDRFPPEKTEAAYKSAYEKLLGNSSHAFAA